MLGERVLAKPPENHSFRVVTDPFVPSACSDGVAIFGGCAEQVELRGILQSSQFVFLFLLNELLRILSKFDTGFFLN